MFDERDSAVERSPADAPDTVALVALLLHRPADVTWSEITAEVLARGSATAVLDELRPDDLFGGGEERLADAAAQIALWTAAGTRLVTILDEDYPTRVRGIHQAPPLLFARGALRPHDPAVSIVGSRAASSWGADLAARLAAEIVGRGITVASGLAMGIDTAAHRAALAAGGRTVAFLGTGITRKYPKGNEALQDEIADRGLLLSQFWPDAPPQKHTFLMRNAVMSGYGLATIVVEAGETSGSRAQARMAVEHGRPVILTDVVARANKWAQALSQSPGVHVASSVAEVVSIVDSLAERRTGSEVRQAFDLMTV